MADWRHALDVDDLAPGAGRAVTIDDDHLAVFHADGGFYAVDARCPHEGYPLAKGDVVGCTLTCRWHNFKYDLRDGRCLVGDEAVRTYPLRVVDGRIEVDLTPPPRDAAIAAAWASLDGAMERRKLGQAARDVVRLLRLDIPAEAIAARVAAFDAARGEYGADHTVAVAADVLAIARRRGDAALPLMIAIDVASEACARRPPRTQAPRPDDVSLAAFTARIAAEDAPGAEAVLAAACADGRARDAGQWLLERCCDHFVDFGHSLIFATKAHELLDAIGWDHAGAILPGLAHALVMGTQEDVLPEWTWFRARMRDVELPAPRDVAPAELLDLAGVLTDGAREDAFDAVTAALAGGVPPARVVDALVLGASARILRFATAHDRDPTVQHGWLDVTHVLTYAHAARATLALLPGPAALRPLWFAARFVNVSRALDGEPVAGKSGDPGDPVNATLDAVMRRDARAAVHQAGLAIHGGAADALGDALEDLVLEVAGTRPIIVAHLVKTLRAARAEHASLAHLGDAARLPLVATIRFLASPVVERRTARLVHEAERFLIEGKVPRTLT